MIVQSIFEGEETGSMHKNLPQNHTCSPSRILIANPFKQFQMLAPWYTWYYKYFSVWNVSLLLDRIAGNQSNPITTIVLSDGNCLYMIPAFHKSAMGVARLDRVPWRAWHINGVVIISIHLLYWPGRRPDSCISAKDVLWLWMFACFLIQIVPRSFLKVGWVDPIKLSII